MVILNWLQIDDCCDMSLKCEFYLNLTVVTSKIISHEQNKPASPVHPFPVAIETLSIPRSLCLSRPLSRLVSVCACPNTQQVTLTPRAQQWMNLPSITVYPFSISDVGAGSWASGELRLTQRPLSTALRSPPGSTAHGTPLIRPRHTDQGGSCTASHDCLVAFPDPVSPTIVTLCSECSGRLSQA